MEDVGIATVYVIETRSVNKEDSLTRQTRAITQSSSSLTCCFYNKSKSCIKLTTAALTTMATPTALAAAASTATPHSAMTRQLRPQSTRDPKDQRKRLRLLGPISGSDMSTTLD